MSGLQLLHMGTILLCCGSAHNDNIMVLHEAFNLANCNLIKRLPNHNNVNTLHATNEL